MQMTSTLKLQEQLERLESLQDERLKRERAKKELLTFASVIDIPDVERDEQDEEREQFLPIDRNFGKHHRLWIDCLQQVADGKIKRLMGFMPPGSAKSTYTSIVYPAWYLGRFKKKFIILASYGGDLPKKFGRKARSIVSQPIYKRIFGCELSKEMAAADEWVLTNGSEWRSAGILAGVTGHRADGIIWDDLVKNREDADSKITRDKTYNEYRSSLRSRLKPNGWEIGISTRWHEDDVAGRNLPIDYNGESGWMTGQDGREWYVVCLPAICERDDDPLGRKVGDRIWPEWFGEHHFDEFKFDARNWSALYQQRPSPETGDYFQADWILEYGGSSRTKLPPRETLHVYGASDYATTDEGGNYTVHVVVGVDPHDNVYILDLWRQRTSSDKWVEAFCDLVHRWKPIGWAEENGQIKSGVGPFLTKRLAERKLWIARKQFPVRGDKQIRAQSIRGRMAMGKVFFPYYQPWFAEFQRELLNFPAGKTDDMVDALGLVGQVLDVMIRGNSVDPEAARPKVLSTDPELCNVTLNDVFEENETRNGERKTLRIK